MTIDDNTLAKDTTENKDNTMQEESQNTELAKDVAKGEK